jgi:hypothetical protein
MFGLHGDTDNLHLHVVINRVDPVTEKVSDIDGYYWKKAGQNLAARIKAIQK